MSLFIISRLLMLLRTVCTQNVVRGRIFNLNQVSFLRFTHNKGRVEAAKDAVVSVYLHYHGSFLASKASSCSSIQNNNVGRREDDQDEEDRRGQHGEASRRSLSQGQVLLQEILVHCCPRAHGRLFCLVWNILCRCEKVRVTVVVVYCHFSGVDVIHVLEVLHIPDSIVNKVKNTSPSAGYIVMALLLYKVRIIF